MNDKIRPVHLQRAAYVYIRQSTMNQVRNHLESQRRQYELQDRARQLGFTKVVVIDEDLGVSGSGSRERIASAQAINSPDAGIVLTQCGSR